jgi:Family of unknown function (DUF6364)
MKTRLNLTIDESLLASMKLFASKEQMSVSELVENYFYALTKPTKKKSILDVIERLPAPTKISTDADLKELFYKEQVKKHGF